MKITGQAISKMLAKLGTETRAVLLFGQDEALVRERSNMIAHQILDNLNDPFRVSDLAMADVVSDPARLADEAAAMSLTGGSRLVRLRDATDAATEALATALDQTASHSLIIVTAGDLAVKSKLRSLCEGHLQVAAVACYAEDARTLAQGLRKRAETQGYTLDQDTAEAIVASAGAERDVAKNELDKLILFAGSETRRLDLVMVNAVCAERGAGEFAELVASVCDGKAGLADEHINRLYADGENGIGLLRVVSRRLWQLANAQAAIAEGMSADTCAERTLGRMAWKEKPAFMRQLSRWSAPRLTTALARVMQAERDGKQTGADQNLLAARALLALAAR